MDIRNEKALSQFQSISPKQGGNRWGAVGVFENNPDLYLIKREIGGYQTVVTEVENDMIVLECLCSALIKKTLGETYAAETEPVKLDIDTVQIHVNNDEDGVKLLTETMSVNKYSDYGLASKIIKSDPKPEKTCGQSPNMFDSLRLNVIINLLGIGDIKPDHFIHYKKYVDGYEKLCIALIDCAGDFSGFNKNLECFLIHPTHKINLLPKYYGHVLDVFKRFVSMNTSNVFDAYQHINVSPSCTTARLKERLIKVMTHVRTLMPMLEEKIKQHISIGDMILRDEYHGYNELANFLNTFPRKFRYQIAMQNRTRIRNQTDVKNVVDSLPLDRKYDFLTSLHKFTGIKNPYLKEYIRIEWVKYKYINHSFFGTSNSPHNANYEDKNKNLKYCPRS